MKEDRRESFLRRGQAWFQKKTTETINVVLPAPSLSPMKTQEFNNNTPSRVLLILIKRQFRESLEFKNKIRPFEQSWQHPRELDHVSHDGGPQKGSKMSQERSRNGTEYLAMFCPVSFRGYSYRRAQSL